MIVSLSLGRVLAGIVIAQVPAPRVQYAYHEPAVSSTVPVAIGAPAPPETLMVAVTGVFAPTEVGLGVTVTTGTAFLTVTAAEPLASA